MDPHLFLKALTIVLCTAGVTTVLFQKLRQPVVLGYMLAGLIVGPHVPLPLVADRVVVQTLSELGVILLMFSLGLEFSLQKLLRVGLTASLTAIVQCSVMLWLGYVTGRAFGWSIRESVFTGAIIAISSTTIIAKAFDEQRIHGRLRELVVGVLVVEDLIAVLLMATLTALASGDGFSAGAVLRSSGRLLAFLVALLVIGLIVVPRTIRGVVRLGRPETTLVASIGVCFACALAALDLGYSVALGAFIAGSLVAESGEEKIVEHLVQPVRDVFAAIFFVSVGMMIEPRVLLQHGGAVGALTTIVVLGKIVSVSMGAFLTGNGTRLSLQAGMSLAQIGEFSFIIAALGISLGATREFLYPVAIAVSALTTLSTPWLIRASGPAANLVDRRLPRAIQTFTALYGTWVERLREAPDRARTDALARRFAKLVLLDGVILVALVVGASAYADSLTELAGARFGLPISAARTLLVLGTLGAAAPFALGIFQMARHLGVALARSALPEASAGTVDFADAPRRALIVTLQLTVVLLVGSPLLALTQPFLPGYSGAVVLALILVLLTSMFWRSATNLQGHVRAGAQVLVDALAAQARKGAGPADADPLTRVNELLPGLGDPVAVRLDVGAAAVGRTLSDLELRGRTGATVLAITRADASVIVPTAREVLEAGDVLAIAGTAGAVEAARALLLERERISQETAEWIPGA